jgi:hypothetical protein
MMTAKSSIHIVPIKSTSEQHNFRKVELDYVDKDLTKNNTYLSNDTVKDRLDKIKTRYKETTGQSMQKKATPIREGVLNLKDASEQTVEDLKQLAGRLKKEMNITCFQIHVHADEGHFNKEKEWKPNYHAHMVFDWTDQENGKSIKLGRVDMIKVQDIVAEEMKMERGVSSDRKHLNVVQFKIEAERTKHEEMKMDFSQEKAGLKREIEEMQQRQNNELRDFQASQDQLSHSIALKQAQIDAFDLKNENYKVEKKGVLGFGGGVDWEKTADNIAIGLNKSKQETARISGARSQEVGDLRNRLTGAESTAKAWENRSKKVEKEFNEWKKVLNSPEQMRERANNLEADRQRDQSKDRGRGGPSME